MVPAGGPLTRRAAGAGRSRTLYRGTGGRSRNTGRAVGIRKPASRLHQDRGSAIRSRQRLLRGVLARHGATTYASVDTVANALMVQLPDELAGRLRSIPGVVRVHPVYTVRPSLDVALPLHKVPQAWASLGGIERAGAGARIAIIDTGIDQTHPGFQDGTLPMPEGFPRGNVQSDLAYTTNKVIVARSYLSLYGTESDTSPRDSLGHGTGVAMIAGGVPVGFAGGVISGVAPKAYLGSYNVFQRNPDGGTRNDIVLKAIDDAIADGMDVINLSLGSGFAPRPSDDLFPAVVERATALGILIVAAAGNFGPEPFTIEDSAVAPGALSVGASSSSRVFSGSVLLATGQRFLTEPGSGSNRAAPLTAPLFDVAAVDPTGLSCGALPSGSLSGRIVLILRGTCSFEVKLNNAQAAGAAAGLVYTTQDEPERFTMTVGSATLPSAMMDYQDGVAIKAQVAASPNLSATIDFARNAVPVDANRLETFSSSGPNTDFGVKPDLVATGSLVTASPGGMLIFGSGTSFSAPLVSGAVAVLKMARPGYPGQQYRSMLINAAAPLVLSSGSPVSVQQAGGGVLNVEASLAGTVTAYPTSLSFGTAAGNFSRSLSIFNLGTAPTKPTPFPSSLLLAARLPWYPRRRF